MAVNPDEIDTSVPTSSIDWNDPVAVAKARGDNAGAEEEEPEEPEEEEEPEEPEEEAAPEEPKAKKGKEPMIPKSRFDAKNKQLKDLEARLAQLEAQEQKQVATKKQTDRIDEIDTEITGLNKRMTQAILDNDADKVSEIQGQIHKLNREAVRLEMSQGKEESTAAIREQLKYDLLIDQLEDTYDVLNQNSDSYDQDLIEEVLDLRDAYMAGPKKMSASQALLKAVNLLVPKPAAEEPAAQKPPVDKKAAKAAARKKAALEKSVAISKKQPPSSDNIGVDADKGGLAKDPDPKRLTPKDLANLPLETLKRMRGDFA